MAHVPADDVWELWNETPQHSWSALHQTLEGHLNQAKGISNTLVRMMLALTEEFQKSGQPYPATPEALGEVLNQHLPSVTGPGGGFQRPQS